MQAAKLLKNSLALALFSLPFETTTEQIEAFEPKVTRVHTFGRRTNHLLTAS